MKKEKVPQNDLSHLQEVMYRNPDVFMHFFGQDAWIMEQIVNGDLKLEDAKRTLQDAQSPIADTFEEKLRRINTLMGEILAVAGEEDSPFQNALKILSDAQTKEEEEEEDEQLQEEKTKKIRFAQAFQLYLAQKNISTEAALWEAVDTFGSHHKFKNLPSLTSMDETPEVRNDVTYATMRPTINGTEYAIFLTYDSNNEPIIKIFKQIGSMWKKMKKRKN